jgi:hypothetical protein
MGDTRQAIRADRFNEFRSVRLARWKATL